MEPTVTVIVPTRNEAQNIPKLLHSLPWDIPLIVVDASSDATPQLVARLRPSAIVIRHPGNVTEARQVGATAATTDWLLFTDADVQFHHDYFARLLLWQHHDALYGPKQSLADYGRYYQLFSRGQQLAHRLGVPAASGSNLLIRRSVFHAIGGFDLTLTVNEDSEIGWRIRQRGYDIAFAPDLIVYEHDHRRLANGRFRKTAHSLLRCALLFSGLMPRRWRSHDWGYWAERHRSEQQNVAARPHP